MLLSALMESLEESLPLTVVGKFPENSAVRVMRRFGRGLTKDDELYVLGPDDPRPASSTEQAFKGYYILYNPAETYVSSRFITVYCDISAAAFCNVVLDVFEEEYTVSSWFHSVYTLAVQSKNPADLLGKLRSIFGNHFLLLSSSLYVVDSTLPSFSGLPLFQELHGQQYLSLEAIDHIQTGGLLQKALRASSAILVDDAFFGHRFLLTNIRLGSYIAGYFVHVESARPFTRQDPSLSTFLAEVMGQMIYDDTSHLTEQYFNDEYFLHTLLNPDGYRVSDLAGSMHWERYMNSRYYQFLVCTAPGDPSKKAATHFTRQLRHIFSSCPVLVEETAVTVLFAGPGKNFLTAGDKKALTDLLGLQKQRGIVSFCFSDLSLAASYHSHSISLLKHLSGANRGGFELFFMEDAYFQMIMYTLHDEQLDSSVIHPDILFLQQYDRQHNSELMRTLTAWLECNRNVAAMSQMLHINKSTGFYRINQIKDLLGDPFSSSQKLFFYECALQILQKELEDSQADGRQ